MMLRKVFDLDNPVMQGLSMAFNLMLLNIIAIITTLPVITAGASLTALFDVSQRIVRGDDIYILKTFFSSFKLNFRKGTLTGLVFLAATLLVVMNYLAAKEVAPMLRYASLAIALLLTATAIYTFALTARFENGIKNTIANAVKLMTAYLPRTLAMLLFTLCYFVLSTRFPQIGMPVFMLFGLSLPVYVYSLICQPIINSLSKKDQA